MCDLPPIIELEDIKGQIAEGMERIRDDVFVDPFIQAIPRTPNTRSFFKAGFAEFGFKQGCVLCEDIIFFAADD